MAYKLVCVYEFYDDISGTHVNRGDEITDYDWMAKLVEANREHHFVKVQLLMADSQWDWPPVVGSPQDPNNPPAKTVATPTEEAAEE